MASLAGDWIIVAILVDVLGEETSLVGVSGVNDSFLGDRC